MRKNTSQLRQEIQHNLDSNLLKTKHLLKIGEAINPILLQAAQEEAERRIKANSSGTKQYCFRAECNLDEVLLMLALPREEIVSVETIDLGERGLPTLLTVRTLSLERVRECMRQVPDGHVMVQTVQPLELYTGERDYDLD